ncbi:glutaredoxin-like protein [Aphelenchoides avenae]|nr:glutaredoxin-like protein [Aphelenchus avenae]
MFSFKQSVKLPLRLFPVRYSSRLTFRLVTSDQCSLCVHFKKQFAIYAKATGKDWKIEEVDLSSSKDLFDRYRYDIPVLLFHDRVLLKHRFSSAILEDNLKAIQKEQE